MTVRSRTFAGAVILLCTTTGTVPAQPAPEAPGRVLFDGARADLRAGEYALARLKLQDIIRSRPAGAPVAESQLLMATALYGLREYEAAGRTAATFITKNPASPHLPYARFVRARVRYHAGDAVGALEELSRLLADTGDARLRSRILAFFRDMPADLAAAPAPGALEKRYLPRNGSDGAERRQNDAYPLGFICPLTGDYAEVGERLLDGAVMAVREFNDRNKRKIRLVVEDSRGGLIPSVRAVRSLAEGAGAIGVAGPMLSNTSVAAAALAECYDMPLVSPTAWEHGIAAIGPNVFQANVPGEVQGALIAEHALEKLGHRTFAVIAPFDSYGKALVRGFEDRIRAGDGTIVAREWYYEGAMDFTRQFERIRRRELIKTLNLMEVTDDTDVEALARGEDESEKVLVPIPSIDAIFIPAYPEEIPMLASQVAFFNIETQILGGDRWNDETIYKEKRYVEGTVFPGMVVRRRDSASFRDFTTRFRRTYKTAPDDVALLGYDGMKLLVDAVAGGADTRAEVRGYLAGLRTVEGVTRTLVFPEGKRYNSHLDFLTIKDGRIVPWIKPAAR